MGRSRCCSVRRRSDGRWPRGLLCPGSPRVCLREASSPTERSDLGNVKPASLCWSSVCLSGLLVQPHRRHTLSLVGSKCCAHSGHRKEVRATDRALQVRSVRGRRVLCSRGKPCSQVSGARAGEQSPRTPLGPGVPTCVRPRYSRCHPWAPEDGTMRSCHAGCCPSPPVDLGWGHVAGSVALFVPTGARWRLGHLVPADGGWRPSRLLPQTGAPESRSLAPDFTTRQQTHWLLSCHVAVRTDEHRSPGLRFSPSLPCGGAALVLDACLGLTPAWVLLPQSRVRGKRVALVPVQWHHTQGWSKRSTW